MAVGKPSFGNGKMLNQKKGETRDGWISQTGEEQDREVEGQRGSPPPFFPFQSDAIRQNRLHENVNVLFRAVFRRNCPFVGFIQ